MVEVNSDGTVKWFYTAVFTSHCPVNVKWFPFDTQVCVMDFLSWAYSGHEVELFPDESNDGTQDRYALLV